eukprot:RCo015978
MCPDAPPATTGAALGEPDAFPSGTSSASNSAAELDTVSPPLNAGAGIVAPGEQLEAPPAASEVEEGEAIGTAVSEQALVQFVQRRLAEIQRERAALMEVLNYLMDEALNPLAPEGAARWSGSSERRC